MPFLGHIFLFKIKLIFIELFYIGVDMVEILNILKEYGLWIFIFGSMIGFLFCVKAEIHSKKSYYYYSVGMDREYNVENNLFLILVFLGLTICVFSFLSLLYTLDY